MWLRHTYNSKNEFCEKLFSQGVAIQPFNHSCDTHIIRKMSLARNYFCEDWQFNHSTTSSHRYVKDRTSQENSQYKLSIQPFQQFLKHTHFENWSLRESKFCESTNSTFVYNIHIFEIQVSWENWLFNQVNHSWDTHIIQKMSFARNYFCEEWQFNHSTTVATHT